MTDIQRNTHGSAVLRLLLSLRTDPIAPISSDP